MSDAGGDTGVVDPIRVPGWLREPAQRWWRDLPILARAFLGLAIVDVVGRSIGLLQPAISWAYLTPLSFVSAYLPHDLWIVLPALLVARRPDAADATPWILRGAVVVAAVELLAGPLEHVVGYATPAATTISVWLSIVAGLATLVGFGLLARGLAGLNPRRPSQAVAGLSNLVFAGVAAIALLDLVQLLVSPSIDAADPGLNQLFVLGSLVGDLRILGWAYLLWIAVRGFGDPGRPPEATRAAIAGAGLAAALGLFGTLVTTIQLILQRPFDPASVTLVDLANSLDWLAFVLGPSLVIAAFALGLADPPIPIRQPPGDATPGRDETPSAT